MSGNIGKCPLCGSATTCWEPYDHIMSHTCPTCGTFWYSANLSRIPEAPKDKSKLASFLFYKKFAEGKTCSYFIGSTTGYELCRKIPETLEWLSNDEVEAWYPQTFSEKVDMFLLGLAKMSKYAGADVRLPEEANQSALFVERFESDSSKLDKKELYAQLHYIRSYCSKTEEYVWIKTGLDYAAIYGGAPADSSETYCLLPKGLKRVDELQRDRGTHSKDVFVAMSFETDVPEVKKLREDIEAAIVEAKYVPLLMDKLPHNGQIVPEMLLQIRQARFVIADFTFPNHGAYYEAGYALGQGKQVIHICRKDVFDKKGDKDKKIHFDVAQINTVVWDDEADLKKKLVDRIKATITQAQ